MSIQCLRYAIYILHCLGIVYFPCANWHAKFYVCSWMHARAFTYPPHARLGVETFIGTCQTVRDESLQSSFRSIRNGIVFCIRPSSGVTLESAFAKNESRIRFLFTAGDRACLRDKLRNRYRASNATFSLRVTSKTFPLPIAFFSQY